MPGIPVEMTTLVKDLYAFRSLSDTEVNRIASMAELVSLDPEAQINVPEGEYAPFYMVVSGRVRLQEERSGSQLADPNPYKAGQFFGADKLLFERNRHLIATAVVPASLLELSSADLKTLLLEIPGLKDGLLFAAQMQRWLRDKAFRWIGDEELVYLISRKHPFFLFVRMVAPVMVILASFLLFSLSFVLTTSSFQVVSFWSSIAAFVVGVGWAIWRFIDWGNDYYVVTDQRVVWVEQVLALYESRREAFLTSIRNKQTRTANWFERQFGYGDIIMTVYAGQIVFKNIPHPNQVSLLIDQLIRRSSVKLKKEDALETEKLIWSKMADLEKTIAEQVEPIPPPVPLKAKAGRPLLPSWKNIRTFFRLDTRFEQGELITYRTHLVFLALKLFLPSLAQVLLIAATVWQVWEGLAGRATYLTLPTTLLVAIFGSGLIGLWALYHFQDWRNDIYQIAPDKVLDKDHKPLQDEHVVQAFLEDVLSMEVERENLFEMMFNFGTVVINSGSDQVLTFDNIPNPARALQDIYNRLFQIQRAKQLREQHQQQEQAAFAVAVYDRIKNRQRPDSPGDQQKT